jgi:hypothetical protein
VEEIRRAVMATRETVENAVLLGAGGGTPEDDAVAAAARAAVQDGAAAAEAKVLSDRKVARSDLLHAMTYYAGKPQAAGPGAAAVAKLRAALGKYV